MRGKLLFLGSGGSMGIPVIGCSCKVCTSSAPEDRRLRPSVLLKTGGKCFLIDIGPDYRQQALKYQIDRLDGLLLTHAHYDHVGGLDELRIYIFRMGQPMPCLLSKETLESLEAQYHYFLSSKKNLKCQILNNNYGTTLFEGLHVRYISYMQLGMKVNGWQFNNLAYVTDIMEYDEDVLSRLAGIEVLIISATLWESSTAHLNIRQAIELVEKIGVKHTYFTHISHEIHHHPIMKELPEGFALAYDGMELTL